jgi:hypothetical protein
VNDSPPGAWATTWFIWFVIALVVTWELWVFQRHGCEATITYVVRRTWVNFPPLPWLVAGWMLLTFWHFFFEE